MITELYSKLQRLKINVRLVDGNIDLQAPQGVLDRALLDEIRMHKADLIDFINTYRSETGDRNQIPVVEEQDSYALSPSQRRLWALSQVEEGNITFNMLDAYVFEGDVDRDALQHSLETLIGRHESLRTVFREDGKGEVWQVIRPVFSSGFDMRQEDLSDAGQQDRTVEKIMQDELVKPFDLSEGPLIRATLIRMENKKWIFTYTIHHIVSDGWSMTILINELLTLYHAFTRGEQNPLVPLPIQYKDYAAWHEQQLKGERLERDKKYWLQQFGNGVPVLELPVDRTRPSIRTHNGAMISSTIREDLTRGLKALGNEQGATLFMGLLSVVNLLMYRYARQKDIVIGTPIAGRQHADLEGQIGFYINTLALRCRLAGAETFRDLLKDARHITTEAYEHQAYPFDQLLDELRLKRDLSRNALFDVMILLQNFQSAGNGRDERELPGAIARKYKGGKHVVSKYDLTFYFTETGDRLILDIEYNTDIFDRDTIAGMSDQLIRLLEVIPGHAGHSIDEIVDLSMRRPLPLLRPVTTDDMLDCTEHQKRLWFIDQFEKNYLYPASPVYHNLPLIMKIGTGIDVHLLQESVRHMAAKYTALETRILVRDNEPFQLPVAGAVKDLTVHHLEEGAPDDELIEKCLSIVHRPFDIENEPLVRLDLLCAGPETHILVITAHHLVADRKSLKLLFDDLVRSYYMSHPGKDDEGSLQFKDFSAWQNHLKREHLDAAFFYWRTKLDNAPVLCLDTDRSREHIHIYGSALVHRRTPDETVQRIENFCREQGTTPFLFLLASFNALLHRYTGSGEIVIGTLYDNRQLPGTAGIFGPLANLIALKSHISDEDNFLSLLGAVTSDVQRSFYHGQAPFEKVVMEVNPAKDMSRTALFDILIHYEEESTEKGFDAREIELNLGLGKYDLNLLIKKSDGIGLFLTYNKKYFDAATVERLLGHYTHIISSILDNPHEAISRLDYIGDNERQQLLDSLSGPSSTYPANKTVTTLFEEQADRTPSHTALVFGETTFTYQALNEVTNQLGWYLRDRYDIRAGDLIAVRLERSEWQVISMLGIAKSGAAYVPVDPSYPQERIEYMIQDSRCKAVIDERELSAFKEAVSRYERRNLPPCNTPADLLYVIYTSGTTGNPKGALIQHSNVVRLMKPDLSIFEFRPADVWTMFHSYSFDFSVWEMYGALLYGGKLVVVDAMTSKDPDAFLSLLVKEGVTILNQTPSAFYNLVRRELERPSTGLSLRYIIFGGEALSPDRLALWKKRYPDTRLINMYGITETTVHVTFKEIRDGDIESKISNIGRPIPTLYCYVMDRHRQLLPKGVSGELYVGGDGVCRGYLNREDLTAQRFLPDPFRKDGRLYRTGDKVKLLDNGELEYGGRLDDQVKIRGYRIETGEIEHALRCDGRIGEAVVIGRPDNNGGNSLIAYLTASENLHAAELRVSLATRLPSYMIPARFIQLDRMPLTSNGKIDKKRLPDPSGLTMGSGMEYIAPRNSTEEKLASVWREILDRETIGVKDDFFGLGGHSLKATRLTGQISREFGVRLALKDIFTNPLLEDQARLIQQAKKTDVEVIPSAVAQQHYPLSSSQRRLWVLSQFDEGNIAYNMPGIHVFEGLLNREALEYAFQALIDRHESLRTSFRQDDQGQIRQLIHPPGSMRFILADRDLRASGQQTAELHTLIRKEVSRPFDLTSGSLIRAALFQLAERKWVFVFTIHHIVSDGWSMQVLINELIAIYNGYVRQEKPDLPTLKIHYKDYATWQQRQLEDKTLEEHKNYWLGQLGGDLPVLSLPTDRTRPPVKTYKGGTIHQQIDPAIAEALADICRQQGGTLFMGLVAAVNMLLYKYTGQPDILIGSTIAGREYPELESQVGFYLNMLPLRMKLTGQDSFTNLFEQARQITLKAYEHQAYPYDELINDLQVLRDLSRNSLFDVVIDLQDTSLHGSNKVLRPEGLDVTPFPEKEHTVSKFDLTFMFTLSGDGLHLSLEYNSDLYDRGTVGRICTHLTGIMKEISTDPSQPVNKFNYLPAAERNLLLQTFNRGYEDHIPYRSVVSLFEEQAGRTPHDIALVFNGTKLTYAELNEKSGRLAGYLKTQYNLKPDDLAGIMMDRSDRLIIAILGVLKAGAAYVPIDPVYPGSRKEYIVRDTAIKVLLTQTDYLFDLEFYQGNIFAADVQLDLIDEPAVISAGEDIRADDLAYVIYTSGSTGAPKGCAITHGNFSNYIQWANGHYFPGPEKPCFGLYTSLSFDLTVTSVFCTLTGGGALHVYSGEEDLQQILTHSFSPDSGINSIKLTPSHIRVLRHLNIQSSSMSLAIVGGEEVTPDHVEILKDIHPAIRIYNEYGPTEATVGCIVKELEAGEPVLIGKPVAGAGIYILDVDGALCPVGIPGEIYICGAGLARGYLHRPELTAERFIPDPFRPGERMYKTGDAGRWLANGDIEFRGRQDDQVKIRGYRVEPGEIAHVLLQHQAVREAIVEAKEGPDGQKSLVAYYVPSGDLNRVMRTAAENAKNGLPPGAQLQELPNGLHLYAYNKTELQFLYKEIFTERCYLQNGMTIPDNACIIDIGANIGMFSLFAGMHAEGVKIYAFEPLPPTFELLKLNVSLYPAGIHVFNAGISDKNETAVFTYFPHATVLSSRYAEGEDIEGTVRHTILNEEKARGGEISEAEIDELLKHRLITRQYECQLKTLSRIIEENNIEKIDYLKIDVEKSELDVLNGIADKDWHKIKRISIEVHDVDGRLDRIRQLLTARGFKVSVNQGEYLEHTHLYDMYAIAPDVTPGHPVNVPQAEQGSKLKDDIKAFLMSQLPDYMVPVYFIQLAEMPLTANGKIDKGRLPDVGEAGEGEGAAYEAPRDERERVLTEVYSEVLRRQRVGIRDDFFVMGGDSIKSIQVVSRLRQRGYALTIQEVMLHPVVEELALRMKAVSRETDQGLEEGEVPLGPIQRWFFQQGEEERHHYNQSVLLQAQGRLSEEGVRAAVERIMLHHDALRMVYRQKAGTWVQEAQGRDQGCWVEVIEAEEEETFREQCERIQAGMDLGRGPLFRVALFRGREQDRLLLVAHHLVIDGVSWRILLEDLSVLYEQYIRGEALRLPLKTDSFGYWQRRLEEYAQSEVLLGQDGYWRSIGAEGVKGLPKEDEEGSNRMEDMAVETVQLEEGVTGRLLTECHRAYRTEINDVLLTGLVLALEEVFGLGRWLIGLEGHGREAIGTEVDVTRTVGWFTTLYPVELTAQDKGDLIGQLIEVKERLHRVPGKGLGYGVLRYVVGKEYGHRPEITFNYLGDFGGEAAGGDVGLFAYSGDDHGRDVSGVRRREAVLDITGIVTGRRLYLSIGYSRHQYQASTMSRLLDLYRRRLEELVDRLSSETGTHLSPVDLTYKGLNAEQLEKLNKLLC